jgi:hypothetical protein
MANDFVVGADQSDPQMGCQPAKCALTIYATGLGCLAYLRTQERLIQMATLITLLDTGKA